MKRRQLIVAVSASALAAPFALLAQQQTIKVFRIGFLSAASAAGFATRLEALRTGLREFGYVEGKNMAIEPRWADGKYDHLPALAAELVGLKVDVLLTHANRATAAAKGTTARIPIVMVSVSDPDTSEYIAGLQRPGGNVTGLAVFNRELTAKRFELLTEVVPRAKRVAFLWNPDNSAQPVASTEIAAKSLKLEIQRIGARGPSDLESAFATMAKSRVDGVVVSQEAVFFAYYKQIALLAKKYRLPSAGSNEFAVAGGMIGYQSNPTELYHRAAYFVDKILKGAKPGDLPVERPTRFELVVNLKAAKSLGIKIPQTLVQRADRVIE